MYKSDVLGRSLRLLPKMVKQLSTPLHWEGIIRDCVKRGVQQFYECGPGESLRELMLFNIYTDLHGEQRPYEFTANVAV